MYSTSTSTSRVNTSFARHTGPVWQVAWAHPKFGQILASCSYDGKVIIWKEQQGQGPGAGGWTKIKEHTLHKASGAHFVFYLSLFMLMLTTLSQLCFLGAARARCHPRMRVLGRHHLRPHFQK